MEEGELDVRVRLPNNPNPIFRERWHETTIKITDEQPLIVKIDRLAGYIEDEIVLATRIWMKGFEAEPGEKVILTPNLPVPDLYRVFR